MHVTAKIVYVYNTLLIVLPLKKGKRTNCRWVRVMVFNTTFNKISVMLWRSVLLMEETGVYRENYRPATSR